MTKRGRPVRDIDEKRLADMIREGASIRDAAAMIGTSDEVLRRRFGTVIAKAKAEWHIELAGLQRKEARGGNTAMLIFLGKNDLDQSDKQAVEHSGPDGGPIKTEIRVAKEIISNQKLNELADAFERELACKSGGLGIAVDGQEVGMGTPPGLLEQISGPVDPAGQLPAAGDHAPEAREVGAGEPLATDVVSGEFPRTSGDSGQL